VVKTLRQAHYDYDFVSYRVFTDTARCRFEDGQVPLGNENYRWVVLPGVDAIPLPVIERLLEFSEHGGRVLTISAEARLDGPTLQIAPRLPYRSADGGSDAAGVPEF
jgi:hypothetical protein